MSGSKNAAAQPLKRRRNNPSFISLFPSHKNFGFFLICFFRIALISFFVSACSTSKKEPVSLYPYENLLTILADCQRHLRADIYRFPFPQDLSGQNAYKSFLVRLANYERLYPDRFPEVLAFTRARLSERLGDYGQAIHYYLVTASIRGEMAPLAEKRLEFARELEAGSSHSINASTAQEYEEAYKKKSGDLAALIRKCSGQDTESLARLEKEKADVEYATFLQDNRHVIPQGTKSALEKWDEIIREHAESKNIQSHKIRLADFYFSLARDYATWKPPEQTGFDWNVFEGFILPARTLLYQVSQEDGYPEKPEARGKLEALLAFMEQIRNRNQ
jgi:hypothetical protein